MRSLQSWCPTTHRGSSIGVFGGLVISHAMVAATKSVKPEFQLHVRHPNNSERLNASLLTHPTKSLHVGCFAWGREKCPNNPSRPVLLHLERVTRLTDILQCRPCPRRPFIRDPRRTSGSRREDGFYHGLLVPKTRALAAVVSVPHAVECALSRRVQRRGDTLP